MNRVLAAGRPPWILKHVFRPSTPLHAPPRPRQFAYGAALFVVKRSKSCTGTLPLSGACWLIPASLWHLGICHPFLTKTVGQGEATDPCLGQTWADLRECLAQAASLVHSWLADVPVQAEVHQIDLRRMHPGYKPRPGSPNAYDSVSGRLLTEASHPPVRMTATDHITGIIVDYSGLICFAVHHFVLVNCFRLD